MKQKREVFLGIIHELHEREGSYGPFCSVVLRARTGSELVRTSVDELVGSGLQVGQRVRVSYSKKVKPFGSRLAVLKRCRFLSRGDVIGMKPLFGGPAQLFEVSRPQKRKKKAKRLKVIAV